MACVSLPGVAVSLLFKVLALLPEPLPRVMLWSVQLLELHLCAGLGGGDGLRQIALKWQPPQG
jgi:hypothetical protein